MYENNVDNVEEISDNGNNDDYEIFKMDEHEPLNDTDCRHPKLIADPSDTIGDAVYHRCSNPKCGVGFYIK
jgi:hypothetical protein